MLQKYYITNKRYFSLWFVFLSTLTINAQNQDLHSDHELTVFAMPTMLPLNWESPSSLYKSVKKCYIKTIAQPDNFLLGHLAIGLKTTLLENPIFVAQGSGPLQQKVDLLMKQKVGFGIMGASMQGRMETEAELKHTFEFYARKNKLAFIRFKINETAATRILEFIKQYSTKMNTKHSLSDYYGGAFWPLFHNEGAGCSAFGVALLDLVQILPEENTEWQIDVNIPMNIIGGEYNNGKKINVKTILNSTKWHPGKGVNNKDYVRHVQYEPSKVYDWILEKRKEENPKYITLDDNNVPGIMIDAREVQIDKNRPIFRDRPEPNLFIDKFLEKRNIAITDK